MSVGLQQAVRPHVRFETRSEEDREASLRENKKVFKDVDWVIVTPVGGRDFNENRADDWMKNIRDRAQAGQYDATWVEHFERMYGMYKQGKDMPEEGTPLKVLTQLFSPAEVQNCIAANIRTLEQLANANEEAIARLPMMGRALKMRAEEAMRLNEGKGSALKYEAMQVENERLTKQVQDQGDRIRDLTAVVQELQANSAAGGGKRGRGASENG